MPLAHVAVNVTDFEAAKAFYLGALEPLGYRVVYEEPGTLAYLADAHGLDFGIGRRGPVGGAHVAFDCDDRAGGRRVLRRGHRRRRNGQRRSRPPPAVRRGLLRRLRPRSGRQQHRGGLPRRRAAT